MSLRNDDVHLAERLNAAAADRWWSAPDDGVTLFGSVGVADADDMPESDENWRPPPPPPPTQPPPLHFMPPLMPPPPDMVKWSSSSLADENASSMYDTKRDSEPLATDRSGVVGGVCGNEHADSRSASLAHSSSMSDADMRSEERRSSSNGKQPAMNLVEVFSLQTHTSGTSRLNRFWNTGVTPRGWGVGGGGLAGAMS